MRRKPKSLLRKRNIGGYGRFDACSYGIPRWDDAKKKLVILLRSAITFIIFYEYDSDEQDAEEQKAWQERRGVWEALEISPELSKEDTVKLLTEQYEQALKQASFIC